MKNLKRKIAAVTVAALCITALPVSEGYVKAADADQVVKLQPEAASVFHDTNNDGMGEFEGWGTSLCWWANRLGYDKTLTSEAARLFFGDEGLDMNIGRYNVGGGDLVGEVTKVPVNSKALFYDLETTGYTPEYKGTSMSPSTNTGMTNVKYVVSDADFGITQGENVGEFKMIGWVNGINDAVDKGDNLHYTVNVKEKANYTVKLLLTLTGNNADRSSAIKVNGVEYQVATAEINNNVIASGNNNNLYLVTFRNVAMNAGNNTVDIGGTKINDSGSSWALDFVKMAVVKSGEEGVLEGNKDFLHSPHITRSDSAVPGYATDVTRIVLTEQKPLSWYTENYTRVDEECGYAWNYDWDADKNQVAILKAAAQASGTDFIAEAFSNSPPYFMTNSGCSSGATDAGKDNLRTNSYHAFAVYMADVIEHWNKEGVITFQSTTPMNEPYTNYWGANSNKQEGCHFDQGESQSKIIVALNEELKKKGIDIIISGTDETNIDTQITSYNKLSEEAKNVISRIDVHTYGGSKRKELSALAESAGKNLWMSEVDGTFTAGSNAGEMTAALGFGKRVMKDVNELKSTAWILWNAIDTHIDSRMADSSTVDYKDWNQLTGKMNLNGGYWGLAIADHDKKEIILTKKYYAYGQFSRYIRPGYTIIGSGEDTLAAYDPKGKKAVIVALNTSAEDKTWAFDLGEFQSMGDKITAIRTSGSVETGENWADVTEKAQIEADKQNRSFTAAMKANSITTFIVEGVEYNNVEAETKVLAQFDFDSDADGSYFDGGNAKATGTYTLEAHGTGKALKLNGNGQHLVVTDKDGKSLLTGVKEMTVSYQINPENSKTNWGFFAAPNADKQEYSKEHYLGIVDISGTTRAERYNNNGARPAVTSYATGYDGWYHVTVVYTKASTILYINGEKQAEEASAYALRDILGENSILYIGKSTWESGEYATALIDNYKIVNKALTAEEVKAEAAKYAEKDPEPAEADKTALKAAIDVKVDAQDTYTEESFKAYKDALATANTVYNKEDATQAEVDAAAKTLTDATAKLEKKPQEPKRPFVDVDRATGNWYYDAVYYNYDKKIMNGVNEDHFEPLSNLARAQFAIILHNMEGKPAVSYEAKFRDVADGQWYTNAILWASSKGIVTGYTDGSEKFGWGDNILREQMAVMMYRYAKNFKEYDVSGSAEFDNFADAAFVDDYAKEAMKWAVGNGIITGKDNGTRLDPLGNASRAECAIIIQRFVEKYEKK